MILDLTYYDDAFDALVAEINDDYYEEGLNKKTPILQMIVNVLVLKLHLSWEQMQINSLSLTIFGFQWTIFRLSSSYSNNWNNY